MKQTPIERGENQPAWDIIQDFSMEWHGRFCLPPASQAHTHGGSALLFLKGQRMGIRTDHV
jgi:hypothetical protein